MSWLNLNQSFNSLKGQITNFASEVLSENPEQDLVDNASKVDTTASALEDKCREQELEIASLKKQNEDLQASLQSERLSKQNGVKEDETSWYWDPPPQTPKPEENIENEYKVQIRALQSELSTLKERDTIDLRPDTEEEVTRLREENQNLTKNLEDLDTQHQQAMERLLSLKKELQKNFEVLKQDHEDLKNSNEDYGGEIKTLLEKLGERDKELESMKTVKADYETLHHKYQNLERIYGLLRENAEKFQEENQELHEEVFKLQEEVTKLEHELEIATKNTEISDTVSKEKHEEVVKQLNDLKDRRNANILHHDEINIDDNAKSVIENLKREINDLKHQLTLKESKQENVDHKFIKSEKVMQLYNKYVNFEIPLDYVGEIPSTDDTVLYKLESVFKTVNSFKKEIDNLEHQLSEKNLNVNHLQTQIDDLTTENDFLTTDIQHYEQELNEMKKNNDFLISEITALKNASKLEPIIESHEDNLVKLETELDVCSKMNKTFESEIKRIEKELAEVMSEKKSLQESLNDLKTKYTTMLNEIDTCKNKTEAIEEMEITAHNQEIEKLKKVSDEIDDLRKRLGAANSKNEQLSIDIHIIENDKVLLTKQVNDLKVSLEEKTLSHKELETLKLAMDLKLEDLEGKLDDTIKNKDEIEAERQNLQAKIVDMENQLTTANNATSEMERLSTEKTRLSQKFNHVIKENSTLVSQIQSLQRREQDLVAENNNLKISGKGKGDGKNAENTKVEAKDPCVVRIVEQQDLYKQITSLQHENNKLDQRNTQLESELSSTDAKILLLDEEFNKLTSDINEKDELIDELNSTVHENKLTIFNLNRTVSELEQSVLVKNEELERLRLRAESLSSQVVNIRERFNQSQEELHIVRENSHDIGSELSELRDEMSFKNVEISALSTRLEEVEKTRDEFQTVIADKDNEILKLNQSIRNITDSYQRLVHEKEIIEQEVNDLQANLPHKEKGVESLYESTINDKDKVIKELNQSLSELTEKLKGNHTHRNDDYGKLVQEKEVLEKEVAELKTNLTLKEKELEEVKSQHESTIGCNDKVIKELNQSLSDLTERFKTNHTHGNDDYGKLAQEKEVLEIEVSELKTNLTHKEKELKDLKLVSDELEKTAVEYKSVIDRATAEKTELINLINLKHNESIQYHNEIQRLNHVLLEQNTEFKRIVEEKDNLLLNHSQSCGNCERLRITLKEKDEIIIDLNSNVNNNERLKTELQNASEVVRNLTERCDNLDRNLAMQLETVKKLTTENAQLSEQEQNSTRELERLRRHLVETEESYTQELMTSEQKLTECQTRLHQVEERAKQTSTVYTSNSIRANQEVETLRNQIKLLEKQREEVQAKLSEADDAKSRSEAALTNLQIVLEQFTLEKDREVETATEKIRNKMEDLKRQNSSCQDEIARLNSKLEESLAGLKAATRLGDQLETKTAQINDLKEQVRTLQTSVAAAEERYYNAISNQQDKVDKNLVKNLLINYVMTAAGNSSNKTQVLRILSTVLDFNQQECERLGLSRSATAPDSLAAEFVKFLENESKPRATLPTMMGLTQSRSTTPVSRKSSTAGAPQQSPHSFDPTHKRNPSTGSNNLLFANLDNVETSSQVSRDSIELRATLDTGVTQTRNNEGAILKHVLRDM